MGDIEDGAFYPPINPLDSRLTSVQPPSVNYQIERMYKALTWPDQPQIHGMIVAAFGQNVNKYQLIQTLNRLFNANVWVNPVAITFPDASTIGNTVWVENIFTRKLEPRWIEFSKTFCMF
jgi:hypothetical protein